MNPNVRVEDTEVPALAFPECGIVVLAKTLWRGIPDDLHLKWKPTSLNFQCLGYVKRDDYRCCLTVMHGKIGEQ